MEIDRFNCGHPHRKRGLAITPVKFGISFTATLFNQAGALVLVYRDGSVQVNHGGTEMGQGLHTKIQQIAAESLGVPLDAIRVMPTRTDKVPNTSATRRLGQHRSERRGGGRCLRADSRARLGPVAASACWLCARVRCVSRTAGCSPRATTERGIPFAQVVEAAYRQRVPLFAQGYYRTPGIHFDPKTGPGQPFHYFAYGAAVSRSGSGRLHRRPSHAAARDILQDVGDSISPLVDRGQIEGGFVQGLGWLTLEELLWDAQGARGHGRRVHLQAAIVVGDCRRCSKWSFWSAPPSRA